MSTWGTPATMNQIRERTAMPTNVQTIRGDSGTKVTLAQESDPSQIRVLVNGNQLAYSIVSLIDLQAAVAALTPSRPDAKPEPEPEATTEPTPEPEEKPKRTRRKATTGRPSGVLNP